MLAPMPDRPLVSIVTPTLNRAELLRHTIHSLRQQDYPNIEHVIVDGGSTDGTLSLLAEHEGTYPLRWISEPDGGMYNAVNKGLAMARGDILAYLNSDDLYFPWTVDVAVRAFERDPTADLVFGDLLKVDDATGRQEFFWSPPFDLDFVRRSGFIGQATVFWRRHVLESEGPFDESLRYVADCDYWMRVGARRRMVKVNEFLAIERNHGETLRATQAAVWTELGAVRERYVSMSGHAHERAIRRHRIRSGLWRRIYWSTFLVQSVLPRPLRGRAWSRLIGAGATRINKRNVALNLVPRLGRGAREPIRPSRYWLERA